MKRRPAPAGALEGGLVVDKPSRLTSHDVVALARRALDQPRIGHTGTLDPMATGVLPLLLGRATRLARFLARQGKSYDATVRFGQATSTFDAEGDPVGPTASDLPDRATIEEALRSFRGTFDQTPPAISAKKVGGHRAYVLARGAQPVCLSPVSVTVTRLELTAFDGVEATFRVDCSAGFYVRSLANDLGAALGVGAHLNALRRTRSGRFCLSDSVTVETLVEAPDAATARAIKMADLLSDLPVRRLSDEEAARVAEGRPVDGMTAPYEGASGRGFVRLLDPEGGLAAVAEMRGVSLHPLVVLL